MKQKIVDRVKIDGHVLNYPGLKMDKTLTIYDINGEVSIQLSLGVGPFSYGNSMTIAEAKQFLNYIGDAIVKAEDYEINH